MGKYQIDLLIQKQSRVGICKPLSPLIVLLSFVIFHANMFYSRLHSSWGRNAPTLYLYRSFNDEGNSINYSLIQMAQKDWHHLQFIVTWVTKMGLAWQSSVTTLKEENAWKVLTITYGTFITPEQVCLSWQVSLKSPQTVNSLSSMSVIILWFFSETISGH